MNNIFLIGMMGSGKSTLAPILAKKLNMDYIDTDLDLTNILDMNLKNIFDFIGEKRFRNMESAYFKEHTKQNNFIYALGGGIILKKENREILINKGNSIFLDVSKKELNKRLEVNSINRPLLNIKGDMDKIYDERYNLYKSTANIIIHCDDKNINKICNEIIQKLKNNENSK